MNVFFQSLALLVLTLCSACATPQIVLTRSRLMMGHVPVNISIRTSPAQESQALQASERAYELAYQIEEKISEYQQDSDMSCLNRNAGIRSCPLSPFTWELLNQSLQISKQTDSAFDLRFGSLTKEGIQGEIELNEISQTGFLLNRNTRLGVGAIGKGFIIDQMIDYLESQGFHHVLISGGGDLRANGGPWEIAIQKPAGLPGEFEQQRKVSNIAIATSGSYEQGAHIINPGSMEKVLRKGSVSVESENLTVADALATAFFVLGKEESQKYLPQFPKTKMTWIEEVK